MRWFFFKKDGSSPLLIYIRSCTQKHNTDICNYIKLGKDQSSNWTTFTCNKETTKLEILYYIISFKQPFNL